MTDHHYIHGSASQSASCVGTPAYGPSGIQVYNCEYTKSYKTTDITGVGEQHISCALLPAGNTGFTGYELFSGVVCGCRGSFIMRVHGKVELKTGASSAELIIEQGSGTDELWAISGAGSYVVASNGHCSFELNLSM